MNILIIGRGSIGERHYRVVSRSKAGGVVLHVSSRAFISSIIDNSYYEQIQKRNIASAIIASPANVHLQIATALVRQGVNVLIEKPIATCWQEAEMFFKLVDSLSPMPVVQVGYNLRYRESVVGLRDLKNSDSELKIVSVEWAVSQYLPEWRSKSYKESVSASRSLGGGVLFELSHELDLLSWLFGRIKWVNSTCGRFGDLEIDVEDTALVIIGFEGARSIQRDFVCSLNMSFANRFRTRRCILNTTKESLQLDLLKGEISRWDSSRNHWQSVFLEDRKSGNDFSYIAQWDEFQWRVKGVSSQANGLDSLRYACDTLKVIHAIRKSSITNSRVEVMY